VRAHWVSVEHDFSAPVGRVFAHLSEHENLPDLFGAKVERLADGQGERNGVGSRRRLRIGPTAPFEETVTKFVPDELIEYEITKGTPLRNHVGIMRFTSLPGGGTHLHYRIRVASPVPGLPPLVKAVLQRNIAAGLAKADTRI
jgi:uncharacterized protein YndB with AHSA1/START domain